MSGLALVTLTARFRKFKFELETHGPMPTRNNQKQIENVRMNPKDKKTMTIRKGFPKVRYSGTR